MKIDDTITPEKSILTRDILNSVSKHLAGRKDCKGINYTVTIGTETVEDCMIFEPVRIRVFPNRYKRQESDKVSVISHVMQEHFPDLYQGPDGMFNVKVDTSKLVKGTYVYESSVDNKRRRWVRIE